MTERGDTQVGPGSAEAAGAAAPEVSTSEGAGAVSEGAKEAVDPAPAGGAVAVPAPAVDESAATPDRSDPAAVASGTVEERPELLVGGAFVGGLVLALVLKKVASG